MKTRLVRQSASLLYLIACAFLLGCSKERTTSENPSSGSETFEVVDVQPGEAAKLLKDGGALVLDVRTPEEFSTIAIEGAINHDIRAEGFEDAVKSLDQSKPYLVHCAAGVPGGRSRKAIDALKVAGATKVYHLEGGIVAWAQGGNPTVGENPTSTEKDQ